MAAAEVGRRRIASPRFHRPRNSTTAGRRRRAGLVPVDKVPVFGLDLELALRFRQRSGDGEPVGQIRVSAADVGMDASEGSDEEVEEQLRRGLGVGGADVETARRNIDGSRGWGFRVDSADRPVVTWTFLKGTMQINVICRWFDESLEARMLAGCGQLVDTLTIA
jgi:hypothetical protein